MEFLVSEGSRGFVLEFWGQVPQLFSVGFRSPGGETIPRIPVSLTQEQRITFVLERTVIYVNYEVVQTTTGSQLILIRMLDPTPGIWTLQVYRAFPSPPDFHVWLPITGFSTSDVIFLEPDPYTTLTTPSATVPVLSPSTYQASNNSFHRNPDAALPGLVKSNPILLPPGFPSPDRDLAGSYENRSGASASAAITSGAAALFLQWGIQRTPSRYFTAQELKNYLGAQKIVWLPRGIYNDETNEHVDNVCAYVGPAEVVLAWTEDENDPQYALSRASLDALEAATDAKGRHFTVHKLPIPAKPICVTEEELQGYAFEEGEDTREAGERLAASYVNFYISNGGIILPQFGDENDAEAVRILGGLFPGRRVYPIPARSILVGGGNIHCVTQQIPRG